MDEGQTHVYGTPDGGRRLVHDGDVQNLGQLVDHDVHVEMQGHEHVFWKVWKFSVK